MVYAADKLECFYEQLNYICMVTDITMGKHFTVTVHS